MRDAPEGRPASGSGRGPGAPVEASPRRRVYLRYWPIALVVALAIHGAAFAVLAISTGRQEPAPRAEPRVNWVGQDSGRGSNAINDALDLFDPAPLFLPTRWNAATRESSLADDRGPGEIFPMEPPRLTFKTGMSPPGLDALPAGIHTASEAIQSFSRPYFSAFGEVEHKVRQVTPRAGLLDVRLAISGDEVMTWEVPLSAVAESGADAAAWPGWEPFSIVVAVESTGTLGPPLIPAPGSGVEEVEKFFRSYLQNVFRPELRLPAGYYRIEVGP